jgi:hypothetical protein
MVLLYGDYNEAVSAGAVAANANALWLLNALRGRLHRTAHHTIIR